MIEAYLAQLTDAERVALDVARRVFGASFKVERTNGYQKWSREARNLER
jgi:hypothetical protein